YPKGYLGPAHHGRAVQKCDDVRLDCGRSIVRQHGRGGDHVAAVVVDDRYHGLAGRIACRKRIGATASLHRPDRDRPAGSEWQNLAANEIEVAHAIEVLVVCHTRCAIAETDLGAEIEADLATTVSRLAP